MIRFIKNLLNSILSFIGRLFNSGKKKTDQLTSSITDGQLASSITESSKQVLDEGKKRADQLTSSITDGQLASSITESSGQVLEKTKQLASTAIESPGQAFEQVLGKDQAKTPRPATQTARSNGKGTAKGLKQADTRKPAKAQATKSNGAQVSAASEALNLPKPKVVSTSNYSSFGERRYPGANMGTFLKMARDMKTAR